MKEREYLLSLYEIYSNLLSEKEKSYFEYYYFEDYSLQEIADNNEVSKAYVGKYINGIEKNNIKLRSPETTLFMIIELVSSTCFNSILYKNPLPIDEFKPYLFSTIEKLIQNNA